MTRTTILCASALVIAFGITACMHWFTDDSTPTLIVSPVVIVGDRGEIQLSVKNMLMEHWLHWL